QNETERLLFSALICTCGCPREALSTCTCGFAHERRAELRAELAKGRSIDEIKAAYAARFGPQALVVPPNTGANRLLWIVPLVAMAVGAGLVPTVPRRWRKKNDDDDRGDGPTPPAAASRSSTKGSPTKPHRDGKGAGPAAKPVRDKYDAMLDEELKELDE